MLRVAVVTLLVVSTACASRAGGAADAMGGIEGRVTIGPTCPVEREGSPCPPGAWSGIVRATSSAGDVHDETTASDGSYQLPLPPGTYTVWPVVDGPGPPTARPETVTVGTTMQRLDLQLDSGIR
jgi:hypothetical protein